MSQNRFRYPLNAGIIIGLLVLLSCGNKKAKNDTIASTPEELKEKVAAYISNFLQEALTGNRKTPGSSLQLRQAAMSKSLYDRQGSISLWSENEIWKPGADSLYQLIENSRLLGLFPEDYHVKEIQAIRQQFTADSLAGGARKDALLWSKADLMLTDAWVQLIKDVKLGRLPNDSITLNKDTVLAQEFFMQQIHSLPQSGSFSTLVQSLEPSHIGYHQLKKGIRKFLDEADFKEFTRVPPPGKDINGYKKTLQKRLFEGGYIAFDSVMADSAQLADAVKKFQKEKGITVDGRAGEGTVRMLNLSDREKFIRIAISMDKYKKLPPRMPSKYIWVNASSNYLDVMENAEVKFSSRIICGKPKTRTPLLNSTVSVLITYPQWVPPPSIVLKEILPAVKKNPGYLARKGFSLLDKDGNEVDPYSVDWTKYSKGIPYKVIQGSGDANALGVLKFHFDNKYSVYLHDTNQRYLFGNAMRSLSHGCVRVQDWEKLALYILRNDSLNSSSRYRMADSLKTWLRNKEKHHIAIKNKMPVYIRYITCEGKDGELVFYDDVYGEDKLLREKYFARK
ncbi:MAG: L,D-transpeptidase family protein [Bacteroidota bacterium]